MRSTGINIVRQLWAHDVGAELAVDIRSPEALLAYYKEDKHSWIVLIKQDGGHGEPVLKVKSMVRKEDAEIRGSELVSWLRGEMKERDVREGTKDRVKLIRHTSHQDTTPSGGEREQDVRMLVALHKGKRPNRKTVSEAGKCLQTQWLLLDHARVANASPSQPHSEHENSSMVSLMDRLPP